MHPVRMMLRIIQLTDCHLFAARDRSLRNIVTWPRFTAVLNHLRPQFREIDLLVITGDTAHDEDAATYEAVRNELEDWMSKVRIIPGNHDNRAALCGLFSRSSDPCEGRVTFCEQWDHWQVIGLDSQRPGELAGSLNEEQLAWLRHRLKTTTELDTLLFLHHPPITVQSSWLDKIGLQDATELERLLRDHPQVRLIGCGHVHQEVVASLGSATVFTTPAVGPAFRPRTDELEIDSVPPGYRVWELFPGGRWSTQALRCDSTDESQMPVQ